MTTLSLPDLSLWFLAWLVGAAFIAACSTSAAPTPPVNFATAEAGSPLYDPPPTELTLPASSSASIKTTAPPPTASPVVDEAVHLLREIPASTQEIMPTPGIDKVIFGFVGGELVALTAAALIALFLALVLRTPSFGLYVYLKTAEPGVESIFFDLHNKKKFMTYDA